MLCPQCQLEMRIAKTSVIVTGDTSPQEETKVFYQHEMACYNPQCQNNGKIVEISRCKIM